MYPAHDVKKIITSYDVIKIPILYLIYFKVASEKANNYFLSNILSTFSKFPLSVKDDKSFRTVSFGEISQITLNLSESDDI